MVGLVQKVVVIIAMTAGLLAGLAAGLPDGIPTTVPPACVQLPLPGNPGLQAGYCPPGG